MLPDEFEQFTRLASLHAASNGLMLCYGTPGHFRSGPDQGASLLRPLHGGPELAPAQLRLTRKILADNAK